MIELLYCIHDLTCTIGWNCEADKLQICVIVSGEYAYGSLTYEASSEYYLFPGAIMIIQLIQEFIDDLDNKQQ